MGQLLRVPKEDTISVTADDDSPKVEIGAGGVWVRRVSGIVATLTPKVSRDIDGPYSSLNINSVEYTIALGSDRWSQIDPSAFVFRFWQFIGDEDGVIEFVRSS